MDRQMPRYFFDAQFDDRLSTDDHGQHFETLAAAEQEAVATAADLARDLFHADSDRHFCLQLRDEDGNRLTRVTIGLSIWRSPASRSDEAQAASAPRREDAPKAESHAS